MTRRVWLILLVSLFIFSGCGKAIYVVKKENTATKLTMEQMERVIVTSAEERGWMINKVSSGVIHLTYYRSKHMAKLAVNYSMSSYSINYLDSKNLKYDGTNIHGTYNKWVQNLENTIDKKLELIEGGFTTENGVTQNSNTVSSLGFEVGKTTKNEVMEKMGGPTSVSRTSGGEEVLTYNKTHVTGKAWIPFYYGNDRVRVNYVTFTFKNNILSAYSEQRN